MKTPTKFSSTLTWLALVAVSILMVTNANAQNISYSPTSIQAWGYSPEVTRFAISVDEVSFQAFFINPAEPLVDIEGNPYEGNFYGIFIHPFTLTHGRFYATPSAGVFHRKFPTDRGSVLNFQIEAGIQIHNNFSISYAHLSNGFGIFNSFNPGVDNINIKIHL